VLESLPGCVRSRDRGFGEERRWRGDRGEDRLHLQLALPSAAERSEDEGDEGRPRQPPQRTEAPSFTHPLKPSDLQK
jgi:hypothetical protein